MMQAAVLYGKEDVRLETLADPIPAAGEIVIQVQAATTCGTDLKVWRRGGHARMLTPPILFGHEAAGTIVALGKGVEGWQIGDRVVANNSAPCGHCFYCQRQEYSLCPNLEFNNGTFAEYLKIPASIVTRNLLPIPEDLSYDLASLTEPLACVLHGIARSGFQPEQVHTWPSPPQIVVIGDGAIGLMFVGVLAQRGAEVIVFGGSDQRLAIAQIYGAKATFNHHTCGEMAALVRELTDGRGADVVIEATGVPTVWERAIACGRPGATINLFGGCPRDTQIRVNTEQLHYNELTLKGVFHNTPQFVRESLEFISKRILPLEHLITGMASLGDIESVLQAMKARQAIKVALHP
ncbi:alcohol dehydrogenase catalytic domain-containing protein [Candidatus Synechococcus calcipolaris G9]|uniref:Alcohol dehydrogenase catalytic domain-containing protein n=1 Tax=Candidatus Synechococcus calcipolaris G9 TaxID=1497997 RepID=A0ABT6EXM4_9SYNE|nr:alcohol dehydrogenase catalytic domain-containing protein [Candidatus Synechococcus calcipolaris]MDG2990536.1 alcohol dehydrogenase catalytic domain-containing protein [Candidatus Synechococcus calcipolaris G9]